MTLQCRRCNKEAELVTGDIIYPHRKDLHHLKFYQCPICYDYVGTHKGTAKPLGELAGPLLRARRRKLHLLFDPYWQDKSMTRSEAYKSMAKFLNIDPDFCHIGMFGISTCDKLIAEFERGNHDG